MSGIIIRGLIAAVFTLLPSIVAAQEVLSLNAPVGEQYAMEAGVAKPVLAAMRAGAVCLRKAIRGGSKDGRPITIAVPSAEAVEFEARGFARVACGTQVVRMDMSAICKLAAANDPKVNLAFWHRFSFTPQERCSLIEMPAR